MAQNQKLNLKDKVDDGEMDLSMCDIQDVPVREISTYRKVHSLDLSNNHIIQLPRNFSVLKNIIKLDLSKNKLKALPDNFGELTKLKHLDLYMNKLEHLPLSFGNLKNLKWLDLKDNPLVPAIKEVSGLCLDSKQCQTCATNIIYFYQKLKDKVDEENAIREKQRQKEKEAKEATAQKLKAQEKKSKKKDKVKVVESKPAIVKEPNTIQKTEFKTVAQVPESSKGFYSYLPLFMMIFLFVSLFVLTSLKLKETLFVEEQAIRIWNMCLSKAPAAVQSYGSKSANLIGKVHKSLGTTLLDLQHNESVLYFLDKIKSYYNSLVTSKTN
ncbi:PREDICTED: leucine-rich repeat-containing protein 59 [Nicrophorus vespilloides]|uniref:Leucine-rich repeat-containing protein 59 n=1 Tax=Nicrophorus vespilloides TaxID=110193 RepID=A0ABM1MGA6_NICVS|nr:PREDICTED: leucine-rich repeat-containing protein 59 [Nicrophorus vespilloides]